jgi:uncharacterized protein YjbI with pentapeptide repeats
MTEPTSLQARVEELERRLSAKSWIEQLLPFVPAVFGVVLLGMLVWQNSLMSEDRADRDGLRIERQFWLLCHEHATSEQRTSAFLDLVAAGNTEWRSARLEKLQLDGVDLAEADLHDARFEAGNFERANLQNAVLHRSSFRLCELMNADLSNAVMHSADLLKADVSRAEFRGTDLKSASLEQSTAREAVFVLADLSDANLVLADLSNANLTGTKFIGANLESAILRGADLALANLKDARLNGADLTDSSWWRARGLTSDQIVEFAKTFPPTDTADESRRNDFGLWLKTFAK